MKNTPEAPDGVALRLSAIVRRFPESGLVIDRVDLEIKPGEFVAILGPSGCGKSTLLRIAAGLDRPDEGEVRVESFGRRHFRGFVFQDACLLPWRTALQNAALPLELIGTPRMEAESEARAALERVGLGDAVDRYPAQLSGGMRMRTSLARALVAKPSLLLLDEPFAALDENTRHALQRDLRSLWEKLGMTVLFVTHSATEAAFLAERAIVLSGRPARALFDRRIELPSPRTPGVRHTEAFVREARALLPSEGVAE